MDETYNPYKKIETSRKFMARKSSCLPNIAGNRAKYPSLPAVSSQKPQCQGLQVNSLVKG